jgi:hypothetical protein
MVSVPASLAGRDDIGRGIQGLRPWLISDVPSGHGGKRVADPGTSSLANIRCPFGTL